MARTELEILNKLCAIEQQINIYLKHHDKYTDLIRRTRMCWKGCFTNKIVKLKEKKRKTEMCLNMLIGMKSELIWVFQRP